MSYAPLCINQEKLLLSAEVARRQHIALPAPSVHYPLRLSGRIDFLALERALQETVRRHAALRLKVVPNPALTPDEREVRLRAFARTGIFTPGLYLQSATECPEVALRHIASAPNSFEQDLQRVHREDGASRFMEPPLLRGTVLTIAPDRHFLLLTFDHIAVDGWSTRVIRTDIETLYQDLPIGEPPASYFDFARWQHKALRSSFFDQSLEFWRNHWSSFCEARIGFQDLPFTLPPQKSPDFSFDVEVLMITPDECRRIKAVAREFGLSLYMVFHTAYIVLLHHYTGLDNIAIWTHFSNRKRGTYQNVVGYFANTHLLGTRIEPNESGRSLLKRVRELVLNASIHGGLPLPQLWWRLRCHPRYSDASLLLAYRQITGSSRLGEGTITAGPVTGISSPRWSTLGIYVMDDGHDIFIKSQYITSMYRQASVRQLLEDFGAVLSMLVSDPDAKVSTFSEIAGRYSGRHRPRDGAMSEVIVVGSDLIPTLGHNFSVGASR